jgi:hypothetical protein|tara:strand:- start:12 stop:386 length:375 start_codon:yes stop_codon:yes gene_type:complete
MSGHLHHINKLVVGIPWLNISRVFREIFVVNPKRRLAGTLKSWYAKGCAPITATKTHLRFSFVQEKVLNDIEKLFIDGLTQVLSGQVEQDIPIWENKIYLENPLLCDGDGPIAKYRKWFTQFYA